MTTPAHPAEAGDGPSCSTPCAPPWIWVWLLYFLLMVLPWTYGLYHGFVVDYLASMTAELSAMDDAKAACFSILGNGVPGRMACSSLPWISVVGYGLYSVADLMPFAVICLGIVFSCLPMLARLRNIDRRGATPIDPDYPSPVVQSIRREVQAASPRLAPMSCLTIPGITAFVSPVGYFRSAVVIGGALPSIWRRNESVGKSIIRHEAVHYRQGEAAFLNVGSPLIDAVRLLPLIFICFVAVPQLISLAGQFLDIFLFEYRLDNDIAQAGSIPNWMSYLASATQFTLPRLVRSEIPFLLMMMFAWIFNILWLCSGLLGVYWTSELVADRAAIASNEEAYCDELMRASRPRGLIARVSDFIVHPPVRLRCWFARRCRSHAALVALLLIFPASLLIGEACMICSDWLTSFIDLVDVGADGTYASSGSLLQRTLEWLPGEIQTRLEWIAIPLLVIIAATALWQPVRRIRYGR